MENSRIEHNERIIQCSHCNGTGKTKIYVGKGVYERVSSIETCSDCGGLGKLLKIEIIIFRKIRGEGENL